MLDRSAGPPGKKKKYNSDSICLVPDPKMKTGVQTFFGFSGMESMSHRLWTSSWNSLKDRSGGTFFGDVLTGRVRCWV